MDAHKPADRTSTQKPQRRLLHGSSRGYEGAVLVGSIAVAAILAFGPLSGDDHSNWGQLVATWCGVVSALILAVILAADLFRPQLVTRRRLIYAVFLLVPLAGVAVLGAIAGFIL